MKTTTKKTSESGPKTYDHYLVPAPYFHWHHFADYIEEYLGTKHWAICSNTQENRDTYGCCLTPAEFKDIQVQYLNDGGDPRHVDKQIAEAHGFEFDWMQRLLVPPETNKQTVRPTAFDGTPI